MRTILYRNVFDKYTEMQGFLNKLGKFPSEDNVTGFEGVQRKMIVLAPLAFEAMLFLTTCIHKSANIDTNVVANQPVDELSLALILDQAIQLDPPQKTYSLFAGMILSAATGGDIGTIRSDSASHTLSLHHRQSLPISTATKLLGKLISGLRRHPDYDTARAARWIRCVVQVVLDRRSGVVNLPPQAARAEIGDEDEYGEDEKQLLTVKTITEQALSLARSALSSTASAGLENQSPYPVEELEWLATTLFNLSIDLYISSLPSNSSSSSSLAPASSSTTATVGEETKRTRDVHTPQLWARKALEIADVAASNPVQIQNEFAGEAVGGATGSAGDSGMLARVLRDRCSRLKWDV